MKGDHRTEPGGGKPGVWGKEGAMTPLEEKKINKDWEEKRKMLDLDLGREEIFRLIHRIAWLRGYLYAYKGGDKCEKE